MRSHYQRLIAIQECKRLEGKWKKDDSEAQAKKLEDEKRKIEEQERVRHEKMHEAR